MSALVALLATAALGQVKLDGADISKGLVVSGGAKVVGKSIAVNGGQAKLSAANQKALDAQIAGKPFALVVSLKDAGTGDTTALALGPLKLNRKAGAWSVAAGAGTVALGKPVAGSLKAVVVADGSMIRAFQNGRIAGMAPYSAGASAPLAIGTPKGGKNPWKGSILDLQVIPRSLMPQEAMALSQSSVATGKSAVVEAELVALTPVPEPKDVLPYKHALITHEYKIVSIKSGGLAGVQAGTTVRVARWGIIGGQKTAIATLKKGAKVTLNLDFFKDHPEIEREFTVDKLSDNFDAPYLYDTDKPGA
ncbi:MAG: hypothetical protein ACO1SV_06430 [Fimbriimonas sp.]